MSSIDKQEILTFVEGLSNDKEQLLDFLNISNKISFLYDFIKKNFDDDNFNKFSPDFLKLVDEIQSMFGLFYLKYNLDLLKFNFFKNQNAVLVEIQRQSIKTFN